MTDLKTQARKRRGLWLWSQLSDRKKALLVEYEATKAWNTRKEKSHE